MKVAVPAQVADSCAFAGQSLCPQTIKDCKPFRSALPRPKLQSLLATSGELHGLMGTNITPWLRMQGQEMTWPGSLQSPCFLSQPQWSAKWKDLAWTPVTKRIGYQSSLQVKAFMQQTSKQAETGKTR